MAFDTQILPSSDENIKKAAAMLKSGCVVGIPTETVYGLAANALEPAAVERIFTAKGRPQDNPLIVHIAQLSDIYKYAEAVPQNALLLAEAFWPGPMTMIFPKKAVIPDITSGGLDTVGIRFPAHKTALAIIKECGFPLAAPSANLSGSPSPTSAAHVYADMNGRIPAVVDGGSCAVGVESTVISFSECGRVNILRPGFVSPEDIASVVGREYVSCAAGVTEAVPDGERVLSPGMKYKHYSPKANVTIVESSLADFTEYVKANAGDTVYALLPDSEADGLSCRYIAYGDTAAEQAQRLFGALRRFDDIGATQVYVRCPDKTGVGLAVYNRLLRAAGFEVIRL